jgi:hypothetical protein
MPDFYAAAVATPSSRTRTMVAPLLAASASRSSTSATEARDRRFVLHLSGGELLGQTSSDIAGNPRSGVRIPGMEQIPRAIQWEIVAVRRPAGRASAA